MSRTIKCSNAKPVMHMRSRHSRVAFSSNRFFDPWPAMMSVFKLLKTVYLTGQHGRARGQPDDLAQIAVLV